MAQIVREGFEWKRRCDGCDGEWHRDYMLNVWEDKIHMCPKCAEKTLEKHFKDDVSKIYGAVTEEFMLDWVKQGGLNECIS